MENASEASKKQMLTVFEKMCFSRFFEMKVKEAYDTGRIKCPIYLSVGQESISSALAVSFARAAIFAQHRSHDFYLAFGGNPIALINELLHQPTGCARGMGGSASIHCPEIKMFGHDGWIGTQIPIAVGYANGSGQKTLAVMGDASAEEDYVITAMAYAATKKLPVLFVCVDNGLSILTKVNVRRNWKMSDLVAPLMPSVDINDDPYLIIKEVNLLKTLPAFLNIRTQRVLWHMGTGKDGEPKWDRFNLTKEALISLGLKDQVVNIENNIQKHIATIWNQRLEATRDMR